MGYNKDDLKWTKPVPIDQYARIKKTEKYKNKPVPMSIPDKVIDQWTKPEPGEWWVCHACWDKGRVRKPYWLGGCLYPSEEMYYAHKNKCRYWPQFSWGKHYDLERD